MDRGSEVTGLRVGDIASPPKSVGSPALDKLDRLTMKRPMPHTPEPSDHPQDLIHLEAAGHFNTWPGTLSRIERGLGRDNTLASQVRDWLREQKTQDNN